jgi:DNA repair protein SbcD/Mre11
LYVIIIFVQRTIRFGRDRRFMYKKVKFIHAADIHLGSILHFSSNIDRKLLEVFNNAVYDSFERLCSIAIEEKVDFVIIAGDIYDKEARSVRANSFFIEQCKRLEEYGVGVFAIGGNHDPIKKYSELFELPSNVHIFSSEQAEKIEVRDSQGELIARLVGQSYKENWDSRKMHENYSMPTDNVLNIGVLHTQLDGNNNYVPCTAEDLKRIESIDYWALGHIHKCSIINESNPSIVFPGIPQGRDIGEEGVGGALLVEAEGSAVNSIRHIVLSNFVWKKVFIKLDSLGKRNPHNLSDLDNIIIEAVEEILSSEESIPENLKTLNDENKIKGYIVNWIVTGRSELYKLMEDRDEDIEQYLIESLNNKFLNRSVILYTDSIELNIGRPIENFEAIRSENSAVREISRFARQCIEHSDLRQQLVKKLGSLWEITDNLEDYNVKKLQLSDELLISIIEQAQQLAVDELLQRGEE